MVISRCSDTPCYVSSICTVRVSRGQGTGTGTGTGVSVSIYGSLTHVVPKRHGLGAGLGHSSGGVDLTKVPSRVR